MKRLIVFLLIFSLNKISFAQNSDLRSMVDSLKFIRADTFNCEVDIYWRIIAKGKAVVPFLIEKLTDTTPTNIKYHCKKTKLNVGEVAHFALTQIAEFPAFVVTKIKFDFSNDQGCWSFYDYLFNNAAKSEYKKSVQEWYDKQKGKYKPKRISKKDRSACQKLFGIDTFYRWKG